MEFSLDFMYAWGEPLGYADFRSSNNDFIVHEELGFDAEGEGEHIYLLVQKNGENTQWVAKELAKFCSVKVMDIGYCGMKDRHAVTRQWFSVYCPSSKVFDWSEFEKNFEGASVQIIRSSRGNKKLRRGQHQQNLFEITLRNIKTDAQVIESRLNSIKDFGVPSYFGEQRFGRDGGNLRQADEYFNTAQDTIGRKKRRKPASIVISAARSYLFNCILDERVKNQTWLKTIEGEVPDDNGRPTAPLWGRGRNLSSGDLLLLESQVLENLAIWKEGLEHCGLNQERRSLVLKPKQLEWSIKDGVLWLKFGLGPGAFATSILRELFYLNNLGAVNAHINAPVS